MHISPPLIPIIFKKNNHLFFLKPQSLFFSSFSRERVPPYSSVRIENLVSASLNECSDIHSLRKLHACILIHGLGTNTFLGSKLVSSYALFDLLPQSRSAFRKPRKNRSLSFWDSILVGYFRAGQFDEVLRVYSDSKQQKIGVSGSAITFSLKSCVGSGNSDFGKAIHVDALKFGFSSDPFVGSSLIKFYSGYGHIEDAYNVFDDITEKDIVVYTSMISAYAQIGDRHASEAFKVARCMQEEQLDPNRVTLVSLLKAATLLRLLEHGQAVHGYAIRRGIGCLDGAFETSLLDMYMKCGAPSKAAAVFGKMSARTSACWNVMIAGHLQLGQPSEALNLFSLVVRENHELDLFTLANGILSCADLGLLLEGMSIHGYVFRIGIPLDVIATTALIDMYSKCKKTSMAREIFDAMREKDTISFNVMMGGYLQNGFAGEVIEAFQEMIGTGLRPNISTILTVFSAFSDLKDLRRGKCMHGYVFRHGFDSNTDIANQVIYMYVNCERIDHGRRVFDRMKDKDLVSWTSMMMGYQDHGLAHEALILFRQMQGEKISPDAITLVCLIQVFSQLVCPNLVKEIHCHVLRRIGLKTEVSVMNSLITAYSRCGMYKAAKDMFEHMGKRDLASWNTMIAASGMHGNCVDALKLFQEMHTEGIRPDEVTFTSVLSSCSHAGFVEEGLRVFKTMQEEYSLVPREVHYNCMVDLLSRAGRLEEAHEFLRWLKPEEMASALGALLAACRVHGNNEMGENIGRWLLELEPMNPSSYGMFSNLYSVSEKWNEAAEVRAIAKERGLKKTTGYSRI